MSSAPAPQPRDFRPPIRVVASARRRRTVSARMVDGVLELRVPAWMPASEREMWAGRMRQRIERQVRRARPTDLDLEMRARALNRRYFRGRLSWVSISYAGQERRWGSCSFTSGVIRISTRASRLPPWVLDYLVVHELAHLEAADHGPRFWELVTAYPLTERARGYLMAMDHAAGARAGSEPASEDDF